MRNVYLYGHLKTAYGPKFRLSVKTPGEAIRLLNANFPGFERRLREGWYELVTGPKRRGGDYLGLDQIEMGLGQHDFHLVPVVAGSKSGGGVIKAVLGVALVGAAIFFSGGTLAAPLAGMGASAFGVGGLSVTWGNIAGLGLMAAAAGISSMISPKTKATTGTKSEDSFSLSGPTNIDAQGYPCPLVIGEVITGGIPVSSGYDVEDIAIGS